MKVEIRLQGGLRSHERFVSTIRETAAGLEISRNGESPRVVKRGQVAEVRIAMDEQEPPFDPAA